MEQKNGLTLVSLLFMIVIILFLTAIIVPPLRKAKSTVCRIICGGNIEGLGSAMKVYANDHDGNYPQLPGMGPWSKELGFAFDMEKPDFSETGKQGQAGRTISASWYLLVREADVSP
ncbi:MAG TPA: hypothetical protein PKB02_02265, partial [Anaerohalosphaeraceae bacterium]|nr:hypothetical protein [Anaerohalosphaeraceae bacterium]